MNLLVHRRTAFAPCSRSGPDASDVDASMALVRTCRISNKYTRDSPVFSRLPDSSNDRASRTVPPRATVTTGHIFTLADGASTIVTMQLQSGSLTTCQPVRPAESVSMSTSRQSATSPERAHHETEPSMAVQQPHSAPRVSARFHMSGDLRVATGLSRTHLDFYLREGIVQPVARTESGYLLFDDAELDRLRQVIAWRQDGVGLREIRRRLGRTGDPGIASSS